jgi:hypothetical protein
MTTTATTTDVQTITVREFMGNKVNFIANDDLRLEVRKGGNKNIGGDFYAGEARVLVTTNVDDCGYANVEVDAACSRGYVDAVEDALEALIVVRDALRKMATAA